MADNLRIVGEVTESLIDASYVALLLSGTVKAYAKDVTATGEVWTGLSTMASSSGGTDTPLFGSNASMSALDQFYVSDGAPISSLYVNVATAGVYTGTGISISDSDGGSGIVIVRYTYQSLDTPVYANNAAALAGGLILGQLYRTGADPDTLCVVH